MVQEIKNLNYNVNRAIAHCPLLMGNEYQVTKFTGNDSIISPTFPNLKLTAQQVFDSAR
ncbi:hypothetical protein ICL16_06460 [Iningainema sp. BLCCT55]|uniref:Uncharacterized protein n=1 Tax=Iningainema tapete BLCC-T55 TaxID=2748662 RepID=A0A8J6XQQ3_9CYAN|nr:hypothetical protein [Iningainema tapete BLCC-T55]